MTPQEREEVLKELTERLKYFSDERLRLLFKSSQPFTPEQIEQDIREASKRLR